MATGSRTTTGRLWQPLLGLRVLDIGRWVAAPFAARLLADLGAVVVRLEPAGGDPLAALDTGRASMARCAHDYVNGGKELRRVPDVGAAVREQVGTFDVLIADLRPGEAARADLEPQRLQERHPALVIGSITGYGLSGPDAERAWSELTAYHAGSEAAVLPGPRIYAQFPDRAPVRAGRHLAEYDAGLTAAGGIVAALVRRVATGEGDLVEISAQEVEIGLNRTTVSRGLNEGRDYDRTYEGYGWQGTLRARDGWVCLRPNEDRHWRAFTTVIGRPELADDPRFATYGARFEHGSALVEELERWTRTVPRATIREAMVTAGVPGAPYLEPAEILDDAAVQSREVFVDWPGGGRAPRQPLRLAGQGPELGPAATERIRGRLAGGDRDAGPLAGLRVLDLTWVASGPYATLLLSSLGADVVKLEAPDRPDLFRRSHGSSDDVDAGLRFVDLNQGKRSVALDLKTDEGRDRLFALSRESDVLVENFRPGVRARLGIGDQALWACNPALVTVSLSGFGATAVDRDRPGYASVFSAESGISTMTGYPDGPPTDVRDSNDLRGGTATFLGAVAGLYTVATGGSGTAVELAMRDVLVCLQGDAFLQASRGVEVTRSDNALEGCDLYGCHLAGDDRWVAVAPRTTEERRALARMIGSPTDAGSEPVVDEHDLRSWIRDRTSRNVVRALSAASVPAAVTASVSDLGRDPHLVERGVIVEGEHPRLGPLYFVACPIRSHAAKRATRAISSPLLGEHTNAVLTEVGAGRTGLQRLPRPHEVPTGAGEHEANGSA